ncbi:hypothetical protein TrST_g13851 [Triparma strigata]|uniref:Uncharacterized protein n=1 Tax=Triparma strigata TaxID=1606541 RepID=A0A9W7BJA1_9STRA|nr:hypothetical protein TrST_g13851 [Triparma strigata]
MSVGATAICIPGATSGHKNDYDIASTGAPTKETYADNITKTSLNYIVERTSTNRKGVQTKRTEYIPKHGGELSTIIKILVGSFTAGPSVFDSEAAAGWGMTHIKDESKEEEKERLEMSRKGSKPFNVKYLPKQALKLWSTAYTARQFYPSNKYLHPPTTLNGRSEAIQQTSLPTVSKPST